MGSSSSYLVPHVMQALSDFSPRSVLDVGVGTGRYGLLCRDLLDYKRFRIFSWNGWKTRIDGIELYEPYLMDYHFQIYDGILVGDARTLKIRDYDVILANDIIEHMSKEDAHNMISKLLRQCNKLIITTPYGLQDSGNEMKPVHEKHISGWTEQDFANYDVKKMLVLRRLMIFAIIKGKLSLDEVEAWKT